jgi:nucleoid DNA-binding protein
MRKEGARQMKNIRTAARRAGVHNIECPHCKRKFNTAQLLDRVFQSILELVRDGEVVNVPRFGIFRAIVMKGRQSKTPMMNRVGCFAIWGDRKVMKWKMSKHTRRFMNPEISAENRESAKKAVKIVAERFRRELAAIDEQKERVNTAARLRARRKAAKKRSEAE